MSSLNNDQKTSFKAKVLDIWYKVFPIQSKELKKFLPLCAMVCLSLFVYNIVRAAKDSILIAGIGAEMISTTKLFAVLPFAIIFMLVYTKMSSSMSRSKVYYSMVGFFISYFLLYNFVLFPMGDKLLLDLGSEHVTSSFIKYPLKMIENWPSVTFYVMSEMWCTMVYTLLLFQIANLITPTEQAKRFYPLMIGALGQVGPFFSGVASEQIAKHSKEVYADHAMAWANTLNIQTLVVAACGIMLMGLYWYIDNKVMTDKEQYNPELVSSSTKKKKVKLSLGESLKLIFSSKYLGFIAILLISYNMGINLVEGIWKASVRLYAPTQNEYALFMGTAQKYNAICSVAMMIIGVQTMRLYSWFSNAIATPIMLGFTGAAFFVLFLFRIELEPYFLGMGVSVLSAVAFCGMMQNNLSKATKYTIFDPTKEMAYIPLDDELKSKGKAAVDVVGSRFGKSGGAITQFALMGITGLPILDLGSYFFVIFALVIGFWIYGVRALSTEYEALKSKTASK